MVEASARASSAFAKVENFLSGPAHDFKHKIKCKCSGRVWRSRWTCGCRLPTYSTAKYN